MTINTLWDDAKLAACAGLLVGAIGGGLAYVGNTDFAEETRQQVEYCENVEAKVWPDYRGNYANECSPDKMKKYFEILGEKS